MPPSNRTRPSGVSSCPAAAAISLLLVAGLTFAAGPARARPDRMVTVVLAPDEEFRAAPGWEETARAALEEATGPLADDFGIRFRIERVEPWNSSSPDYDLAALHDELAREVPPGEEDLVIGLTGAEGPSEERRLLKLGHSDTPGRLLLVSSRAGPDLPLVLRHELAHSFGVPHVRDVPSVMNEEVRRDRTGFDEVSAAILRNNIDLDFKSPVPFAGCRLEPLRAAYDALAERGNAVADLVALVGDGYRRRGRLDEAEEAYRRAAGLDPDLLNARLGLGMIAMARHQYAEAARLFEEVRQVDPDIRGVDLNLGLAYAALDQDASAEFAWRRAITAALDDAEAAVAHRNLASLLLEQKRREEAREHIEASLRLNPAQADADEMRKLAERLRWTK
jgi:tetratricopeptide (TPR) repeat protein